eukprot:358425-Chlamydomonas_euryale.AAC.2
MGGHCWGPCNYTLPYTPETTPSTRAIPEQYQGVFSIPSDTHAIPCSDQFSPAQLASPVRFRDSRH